MDTPHPIFRVSGELNRMAREPVYDLVLKFGFWRPTDQTCYQIWNGRMSREPAVEHVRSKQYEFPHEYLKEFLEYHEITESEFRECEESWRNHDIWHKVNGQWRLKHEIC